jgi:hypothetical protein
MPTARCNPGGVRSIPDHRNINDKGVVPQGSALLSLGLAFVSSLIKSGYRAALVTGGVGLQSAVKLCTGQAGEALYVEPVLDAVCIHQMRGPWHLQHVTGDRA